VRSYLLQDHHQQLVYDANDTAATSRGLTTFVLDTNGCRDAEPGRRSIWGLVGVSPELQR
jgi:hypothetical protein